MSADAWTGAEETASEPFATAARLVTCSGATIVGATAAGRDPTFESAREDEECMATSNSAPIPNTVPAAAPAIATARPGDWTIDERSIAAWPSVPPVIAEWEPVAPIAVEEAGEAEEAEGAERPCLPVYD
jgi:hypothetical protein